LLTRDELYFDLAETLNVEDFYDRGHAAIFRTIVSLINSGKRVNATLVLDYLRSDTTAKVDPGYLDTLMEAVADVSDTKHYAVQVADLARRRRLLIALQDSASKIVKLDPLVPSSSVIDQVETDILNASRTEGQSMRRIGDWANLAMSRIADAVEYPKVHSKGLKWGLLAIDDVIGPLQPGKLCILGGRAGSGKSALAGQVAEAWGEQAPGYIQSLEMEGDEWAERSMSYASDIPAWKIHRASLNEGELGQVFDAAARLRSLPVWIDHRTRLSIEQIRARAIRYKHQYGIRWLILDHLHLVRASKKGMSPLESVDENAKELKQIAKELSIAVLALAQTNKEIRNREGGRPRGGDLLYYSSIEPHADFVLFTHRPEIHLAEQKPDGTNKARQDEWLDRYNAAKGQAEIVNAKARATEAYKTKVCRFVGHTMRFEDLQQEARPTAQEEMSTI
jgi:replicative DNA helicase